MKKLTYVLSVFAATLLLVVSAGCSNPQEYASDDSSEVVEVEEQALDTAAVMAEIDQLRNGFMAMVEGGDYSQMQNMAHPEFMAVGPTGPKWDELRSYAAEGGAYPVGARLMISPMETTIINDTWAFEMGKSQMNYLPEGASGALILHDTYLMIFKNEGNGWRLYREVATNVLPAEMEESM